MADSFYFRFLVSSPPQRPDLTPPKRRSYLSIGLAIVLFCMAAIALSFLSNFMLTPVFVIGAAVFGFTALHYVLWGWWLGRMIREEEGEEE